MVAAKDPILSQHFSAGTVLVPMPGSAPRRAGSLWTPLEICTAIVGAGVGASVSPLLERRTPVVKSSTAPAEKRPKAANHFESMAVVGGGDLLEGGQFTIVDDVITRGATMLAAYSLMVDAYPAARITAFAAVRTMSGQEVTQILDAVSGTISLRQASGDCFRNP